MTRSYGRRISVKNYESARVAVDAALLTVIEGELRVYLRPREKNPCQGQLELVGGLLLNGESAEESL